MDDTELPPKRKVNVLRVVLLFVLLAAAIAGYMRYFNGVHVGGNQMVADNLAVFDTRLQNAEKGIVQHEDRIRVLEDTIQKLTSASAAGSAAAAMASPATPPASSAAPASDDRIAAMEKEIAALKAGAPAQDGDRIYKSIRQLSALHRLSDKIIGGKPFASELTAFEEVASPDESAGGPIATLAPYADSGIPTFATLLVTFDQSVEGLSSAQAVPPPGAGFMDRLKYNLAHVVTIRRIDEAQGGGSADAIVGRAQAHLEREEIEAAVAEIKSLPDNLRGNFAAWLDDAQMVTEAPSLVAQVEEQVMQKAFAPPPAPAAMPAPSPAPSPSPTPTPSPAPAEPPADNTPASTPKT